MTTETKNRKAKTYTDKDGNSIPSTYIHKTERDKDAAARRLTKAALKHSEALRAFKTELLRTCDELHQAALNEHQVKLRANSKGTYTISTIDKKMKVEVRVAEFAGFGDDISIAHALIKEYLAEKTEGIDPEIAQFATSAFENTGGNIDVKRVLGLKRFKVQHPKWRQAMEVIDRAYEIRNTKRYPRVWIMDEHGEYQIVKLDFASL